MSTTHHSGASISVHDGGIVYVLVNDLATFNAIPLPVNEGKCLSKTLQKSGECWIIFQFWA